MAQTAIVRETGLAGKPVATNLAGELVGSLYFPGMLLRQDREVIDSMEALTGWAALGNDTTGLATEVNHVLGALSLEFDKVDGLANTIFAGIEKTITSLDLSRFLAKDLICSAIHVSSVANVAYAFVRLGTSASHYNEWRFDDTSITAGAWTAIEMPLNTTQDVTGNGWDQSAVTYAAIGTAHDAETDALADIRFDHLHMLGGMFTTS